jgi:hypothetical protein
MNLFLSAIHKHQIDSEGLWRTLGISGVLDFVRWPLFKRTQRFGNWICCRPQLRGVRQSPGQWLWLAPSNGPSRVDAFSTHLTETDTAISSSWGQDPWGSRPEIFFFLETEPLWSQSKCNILSAEDGFVSYEYAWPFVKCTCRTYGTILKILPYALYTRSLSVQTL